jgi:hypothetical protein
MRSSHWSATFPRTDRFVGLTRHVDLGIVIPLIVLPIVIVGGYLWYRRSMTRMRPDDAKPISGVRLTAEALHRESPPWRVIYEIGGTLGGVDHVIVGPAGIIAITTVVADRPSPQRLVDTVGEAQLVSDAAVARGPVDEVARPASVACRLSAKVFWGSPDPARPAHDEVAFGSHLVEGQRIHEWLTAIVDPTVERDEPLLDASQVDLAWQSIVMGIGRPNPLT